MIYIPDLRAYQCGAPSLVGLQECGGITMLLYNLGHRTRVLVIVSTAIKIKEISQDGTLSLPRCAALAP
jgi:hypothetical protein